MAYNRLADTITDPQRAERFVGKDSAHYLQMAEAFNEGQIFDESTAKHREVTLTVGSQAVSTGGAP